MAKQTWNVDRKKGGTFSFKLDAQGNYTLQKDGFEGVKTLNLPELQKEKTTTTTTQDTKKISDQTQKAFGDVQPFYYRGGGADSNEQYINEYKIKKDKSLDTDTEPTGAWDRGRWGPKPETRGPWDEGQWGPQPSKGDLDQMILVGHGIKGNGDLNHPKVCQKMILQVGQKLQILIRLKVKKYLKDLKVKVIFIKI